MYVYVRGSNKEVLIEEKKHVLRHVHVRHVLEHVPTHVLKHMIKHMLRHVPTKHVPQNRHPDPTSPLVLGYIS